MTQIKPKRKLKSIDFSGENSHIALVGKSQGGPANGANYALVLKNLANPSPSFIEKASMIQVTMTITDYLEKFYSIWGSDARVLAEIFGFDVESPEDDFDYDEWIEERVKSVKVLKAIKDTSNVPETLASLSEEDYLDVLQDQEVLEKALKEFESSQMLENKVGSPTANSGPTGTKKIKKEKKMTQEVETIEKSKYVEIEKAMQAQAEELLKAREMLATIEKAEKALILKTKTDAVNAVVKDAKHAETVLKAALALEKQEDFDALVNVFKSMQETIEKSAGFTEVGASVQAEEKTEESKTMQFLKSKYAQKETQ